MRADCFIPQGWILHRTVCPFSQSYIVKAHMGINSITVRSETAETTVIIRWMSGVNPPPCRHIWLCTSLFLLIVLLFCHSFNFNCTGWLKISVSGQLNKIKNNIVNFCFQVFSWGFRFCVFVVCKHTALKSQCKMIWL